MPRKRKSSEVDGNLSKHIVSDDAWTPKIDAALKLLLSIRLTSAIWSNVSDCDETFNYWEPGHYLLYGWGFQTWEYSPEYALRSYAYIVLHILPVKVLGLFIHMEKVTSFFLIRCFLACICAICEVYFYRGVIRKFGPSVSRLCYGFMILSAGMFISSAAWLPSSFSMYMTLLSYGAWFSSNHTLAIFATAVSTFIGWPFAAVLGVPIALDLLFVKQKWRFFMLTSLCSLAFLVTMVIYDSMVFGKLVIAPLNIVTYNVFTNHGPNLYGVEPFSYYIINGFLNFNVAFILAGASLIIVYGVKLLTGCNPTRSSTPYWLCMSGFYLWIIIFFSQPHKEERFLFPIYPLICLFAAVALVSLQKFTAQVFRHVTSLTSVISTTPVLILIVSAVLSTSRVLSLYNNYHGSFELYMNLSEVNSVAKSMSRDSTVNICVGKEWYRFPSNFFIPCENCRLKFIKSEFRGQLPAEYLVGANGASVSSPHMNDMNREEPSRYVTEKECHFLVDLDIGTSSLREPNYSQDVSNWEIVSSVPFLNSGKSHSLHRAFYTPFSKKSCVFGRYNLLKSKRKQLVGQKNNGDGSYET